MEDMKTSTAAQDKWNWKTQKYGVKERTTKNLSGYRYWQFANVWTSLDDDADCSKRAA